MHSNTIPLCVKSSKMFITLSKSRTKNNINIGNALIKPYSDVETLILKIIT